MKSSNSSCVLAHYQTKTLAFYLGHVVQVYLHCDECIWSLLSAKRSEVRAFSGLYCPRQIRVKNLLSSTSTFPCSRSCTQRNGDDELIVCLLLKWKMRKWKGTSLSRVRVSIRWHVTYHINTLSVNSSRKIKNCHFSFRPPQLFHCVSFSCLFYHHTEHHTITHWQFRFNSSQNKIYFHLLSGLDKPLKPSTCILGKSFIFFT